MNTVYIVELSWDYYGFVEELRCFSSRQVAEHYKSWCEANHERKDHKEFMVAIDEVVVEDSF